MSPPSIAALANVTVENTDALHCGVCCLPLRPPIFLGDQGHFLCASCRDELDTIRGSDSDDCTDQITGGHRRCDAMEKFVESIRVPCPNAAYGCKATPAYYDHGLHVERCRHRPCRCPAESCGFTGSMSSLLGHFTTVHEWPLTSLKDSAWDEMYLGDGCNVLDVVDGAGGKHLLLLTVSPERLGRAISVTCVDEGAYLCCELLFGFMRYKEADRGSDLHRMCHRQGVIFFGLYDRLGEPDACFHMVVPRSFYPDEQKAIRVLVRVKFD